jgi:hypothetical protein
MSSAATFESGTKEQEIVTYKQVSMPRPCLNVRHGELSPNYGFDAALLRMSRRTDFHCRRPNRQALRCAMAEMSDVQARFETGSKVQPSLCASFPDCPLTRDDILFVLACLWFTTLLGGTVWVFFWY